MNCSETLILPFLVAPRHRVGKALGGSVLAQRDLLEGLLAKLSAERSQLSIFADLTDDYRALESCSMSQFG